MSCKCETKNMERQTLPTRRKAAIPAAAQMQIPYVNGRGSGVRPILDDKGECKGYRSLIAHGSTGQTTVGAGGDATAAFSIEENAPAHRFILTADSNVADLSVQSIKVDNDELVTGDVPATMFAHDSVFNPLVGKWFTTASKVSAQLHNYNAAAIKTLAAFTA